MWQGWFFLLLTIVLWGTTPILEKSGLKSTDPATALFIRSCAVFFCMIVWFGLSGRIAQVVKLPAKTILIFCLSGLFAGFLAMLTYFKILKVNPTSKIVPLTSTYPLFTAVLSLLILKEGFSWQRIIGTILIAGGVLLVR
tara:strand:- start:3143 stop:3562 length:420 start_codon:yes stop_codon:yes gene_type:complete